MHFKTKIPITIHPAFWIVAALIGWIGSQSLAGIIVWIVIIFISVLAHEAGHAVMALAFHQKPQINLVPMGGVTTFEGRNLKFWQQFLITLNGPIFGFLLFFLAWGLLKINIFHQQNVVIFLNWLKVINLFWTIVNLLPVLPLDGGQLLRIAMEAWLGVKGFKISLFIGMLVSFSISLSFFVLQNFIIGALFFLFAFQSFDMWRRARYLSASDRKKENADMFQAGEKAFTLQKFDEAKEIFIKVREQTKEGVLYVGATYYLALILEKEKQRKEAYDLLLLIEDKIPDEGIPLLQELAFEQKNYTLVVKLAASCYQRISSQEVALRNAKAYAALNEAKPAGGWLKTAMQQGNLDLEKVLQEEEFKKVKEQKEFQHFFEK